jgi:guanylate kinase
MYKKGQLFIISAPSGTGKTSLVNLILERLGVLYSIDRVITYTSRKKRFDEIHGEHYHFLSIDEFENKIEEDFFMEWSNFYGDYYGTPKDIRNWLELGKNLIAVVDRPGAKKILEYIDDAVSVWIYTSNIEALHNRLINRATEEVKEIEKRINLARYEISAECQNPLYKYHLENDDFDHTMKRLKRILIKELRNLTFL